MVVVAFQSEDYSRFHVVLDGYNDSNWISYSNKIKSTSSYIFILSGGAVS